MNDEARQALRELTTAHPGLHEDLSRASELIRERLSSHRREALALTAALDAGVPQRLLSSPRGEPIARVIGTVGAELAEELGLAEASAEWAVSAWAEALGLLAAPAAPTVAASPDPEEVPADPVAEVVLHSVDATTAFQEDVTQGFSPEELEPQETPPEAPPREASPADKKKAETWLREANVLRMRGKWSDAVTRCRQALHVYPNDPLGLELLGDLLAEHGELEEAQKAFQRARDLDPTRSVLDEKLGRILVIREQEERERIVEDILGKAPEPPADLKRRSAVVGLVLTLIMLAIGMVVMLMFVQGMEQKAGKEGGGE